MDKKSKMSFMEKTDLLIEAVKATISKYGERQALSALVAAALKDDYGHFTNGDENTINFRNELENSFENGDVCNILEKIYRVDITFETKDTEILEICKSLIIDIMHRQEEKKPIGNNSINNEKLEPLSGKIFDSGIKEVELGEGIYYYDKEDQSFDGLDSITDDRIDIFNDKPVNQEKHEEEKIEIEDIEEDILAGVNKALEAKKKTMEVKITSFFGNLPNKISPLKYKAVIVGQSLKNVFDRLKFKMGRRASDIIQEPEYDELDNYDGTYSSAKSDDEYNFDRTVDDIISAMENNQIDSDGNSIVDENINSQDRHIT